MKKTKIKSAVRTDFILSIEIVVIALGTVMEHTLMLQIMVVSVIAALATIGVYGIVALIVRMDDVGFSLISYAKKQTKGNGRACCLDWNYSRFVSTKSYQNPWRHRDNCNAACWWGYVHPQYQNDPSSFRLPACAAGKFCGWTGCWPITAWTAVVLFKIYTVQKTIIIMNFILFDLDGTISDPMEGIHNSLNYALRTLDYEPCDRDTVAKFIGPPLDVSFPLLTGCSDKDKINEFITSYREYFAETGYAENRLYPGVADALTAIVDSGIRLGLCTYKRKDFAEKNS